MKSEAGWREPLAWDRKARAAGVRRKVFCASIADVFEDWPGPMVNAQGRRLGTWLGAWPWAPCGPPDQAIEPGEGFRALTMDDVRRRLAGLIRDTPNLIYLLLTKRPENASRMLAGMFGEDPATWPRNYWLGTTAEDQANADRRIPELLRVPAPVRFLSCEPLLGPLDLTPWLYGEAYGSTAGRRGGPGGQLVTVGRPPIDWVIVGGESGARDKARPFNLAWARSIRDQGFVAGVPVFVKQLGTNPYTEDFPLGLGRRGIVLREGVGLLHPKGEDMSEWPPDLQIQEFPNG